MPAPLTRSLGAFAAGLRFEHLPEAALAVVRLGFTDCVATILAGVEEPVARIVREQLGTRGAKGEARLVFGAERASAPEAALANGTAGHALDYDDVALTGHPSVVLVPAVLAEAEALGADGRAAAAAYVVGYETWAHLSERDRDPLHSKGWHPTAVVGTVAAAAAVANLRGLDAEKATMAIAIAASMSAGLVANFGTMTKPFQAGRAAQSGITAARLAGAGFTGSADAIEHPLGFLHALSPENRVDTETPLEGLGQDWRIVRKGLNVKKYPMCYCTHRAIDGMLDLARANKLTPGSVRRIAVDTSPSQAAVLRNRRPQTGLEAKFSMEFAMASALTAGRAGLGELTDAFVRRPEVQQAMAKVEITTTQSPSKEDPLFAAFDRIEVTLDDGRRIQSPELHVARGHWSAPLTREEIWTKFRDCAATRLQENRASALFEGLQALDRQSDLRALGAA
ncbi:MAG TPA: MmgE/PrpD family protein [Stellaceae bacterium]|nr:MmgE/PrpD family protein [Stellaceae bacterium]